MIKGYNKKYIPMALRAQNLRQGIVIKTGFGTWVSQIKLGSFVGIYYLIFNLVA